MRKYLNYFQPIYGLDLLEYFMGKPKDALTYQLILETMDYKLCSSSEIADALKWSQQRLEKYLKPLRDAHMVWLIKREELDLPGYRNLNIKIPERCQSVYIRVPLTRRLCRYLNARRDMLRFPSYRKDVQHYLDGAIRALAFLEIEYLLKHRIPKPSRKIDKEVYQAVQARRMSAFTIPSEEDVTPKEEATDTILKLIMNHLTHQLDLHKLPREEETGFSEATYFEHTLFEVLNQLDGYRQLEEIMIYDDEDEEG
jgi:hypothetical protein